MERPAKGEEVTLARSAGFALAQLLGVASLVSVMLTLTSGNPLRNLPAAAALVLALRVLARVRLDARWDADTRRLSVSLTRRDAPGEPSADVSGAVDAFPPASAPARATRISSDADARPPRPPAPALPRDEPAGVRADDDPAPSLAFPSPRRPTEREVELRRLLRRVEDDDADARASADASSSSSPPADAAVPGGVLGAWSRLREHILDEFIAKLWYRSLTDDEAFLDGVRATLDAAFAELARRARAADLDALILRVVPAILTSQLEAFRAARDECGGVDAYVRLTPAEADLAIADALRALGALHPGVDYAGLEGPGTDASAAAAARVGVRDVVDRDANPALAARDPALAALANRCDVAAAALLADAPGGAAKNPVIAPLVRELLAACALRPLLGFFSPSWAHRGLAFALALETDEDTTPATATAGAPGDFGDGRDPPEGRGAGGSGAGARGSGDGERRGRRHRRRASTGGADVDGGPSREGDATDAGSGARGGPGATTREAGEGGSGPRRRRNGGSDAVLAREDPGGERREATPGEEEADDERGISRGGLSRGEDGGADAAAGSSSVPASPSSPRVSPRVVSARVVEVHIAGKGAGAYAVYTVRVRVSGEDAERAVPRRFRNFERLHRRLVEAREAATSATSPDPENASRGDPPLPPLPRKRYLMHSLDGSFVEARRALLDRYLVAIVERPRLAASRDVREFLDVERDPEGRDRYSPDPGGALFGVKDAGSLGGALVFGESRAKDDASSRTERKDGDGSRARSSSSRPGSGSRWDLGEDGGVAPGGKMASSNGAPVGGKMTSSWSPGEWRERGDEKERRDGAASTRPPPFRPSSFGSHGRSSSFGGLSLGDLGGDDMLDDASSAKEKESSPNDSTSDRPATSSADLLSGPLLGLFESVFRLRAKGLVRRTIVAIARQFTEFLFGSAVEDFVTSRLRALRSPATVAACIDRLDAALWPNGTWYRREESDDATRAAEARLASARRDERNVLRVRDAVLAGGGRGPLPGLLGSRTYVRAALDVLGAARSELVCRQTGLVALEAALDALFPETTTRRLPPGTTGAGGGQGGDERGGEGDERGLRASSSGEE